MPGVRSHIPQVARTARHLRVSYSYYKGVPAPITNGGLNEHGVAVRDVWSTSSDRLNAMTPADQQGPNYSDLARIVLERATTARHGVELIGELIATYGYSTYGGNSHFIADEHEGWVVIEFAGGQGLWVAERIGPDQVRVSRPGYIEDFPLNFAENDHFMGAPHLISFAIEQGWYDPDAGQGFNINQIYGDGRGRWDGVTFIEDEMARRAARPERIGLTDLFWAVRTPKLTGDTAGYGQVVPLGPFAWAGCRHLWHTQTAAAAAPFVPVYLGTVSLPEEYGMHRYLTVNEAGKFVDGARKPQAHSAVSQGIESTRSAFRVFKRLLYLIMERHEAFLPEVTPLFEAAEAGLMADQAWVLAAASRLYQSEESAAAEQLLTYVTHTELNRALSMAETLCATLELKTRLLYGIRDEPTVRRPEQIW